MLENRFEEGAAHCEGCRWGATHLLIEDSDHAPLLASGDIFDNVLIHGDNLLALKALESEFIGKVKCVYIDPPFNA